MGMQIEVRLALRNIMRVKMVDVLMKCGRILDLRTLQLVCVNPGNRRVPQRKRQQHLHPDRRPTRAAARKAANSGMNNSDAKRQKLIPGK